MTTFLHLKGCRVQTQLGSEEGKLQSEVVSVQISKSLFVVNKKNDFEIPIVERFKENRVRAGVY